MIRLFRKQKSSLSFIAFFQALGIVIYCGLVGIIFWKGNEWFGRMNHYFGPVAFLIIFIASALITALLGLGYPIYLFWDRKQTKQALMLVAYTSLWLSGFAASILFFVASA